MYLVYKYIMLFDVSEEVFHMPSYLIKFSWTPRLHEYMHVGVCVFVCVCVGGQGALLLLFSAKKTQPHGR